jgi:ryanodine receptor 2
VEAFTMSSSYRPVPIDTARVALPAAVLPLVERLAENAHDQWAARRIHEGWSLGPKRDDAKKTTPNLVAYGELPESEKEYDRDLARETLKAIVALGFRIERAQG